MSFTALLTERDDAGTVSSRIATLEDDALPQGNVTVAVEWAGFNYKDGLCLTGRGALVRNYPHVAGIDFSGTVLESGDDRYRPGDRVILTGWRVGEVHWGGFAQKARVNADWLVPLPAGMTTREAMVLGTAGLTAMLAIAAIERGGVGPDGGEVLITGAGGGVGSMAVLLLARLGYTVAALSGRPALAGDLRALGAASIVERDAFLASPDKPLDSARWAAAVDCTGGPPLGKLLRQMKYGGVVAALGNAAGFDFTTSVLPFILRAVTLQGVESVTVPYAARLAAWDRLARDFDHAAYAGFVEERPLVDLPAAAADILAGRVRGRIVVRT